jgi:hypothetical protein
MRSLFTIFLLITVLLLLVLPGQFGYQLARSQTMQGFGFTTDWDTPGFVCNPSELSRGTVDPSPNRYELHFVLTTFRNATNGVWFIVYHSGYTIDIFEQHGTIDGLVINDSRSNSRFNYTGTETVDGICSNVPVKSNITISFDFPGFHSSAYSKYFCIGSYPRIISFKDTKGEMGSFSGNLTCM